MKNKLKVIAYLGLIGVMNTGIAAENSQLQDNKLDVLCPNKVDHRMIYEKRIGLWCDTVFTKLCDKNKTQAARNVCTSAYADRLSRESKTTTKTEKVVIQTSTKKTDYERQLQEIEFEKQRIELRQRELDIKKQELDLIRRKQEFQAG